MSDEEIEISCDLQVKIRKILRDYKVSFCSNGIEVEFWSPEGEDMPVFLSGCSLEELANSAKKEWNAFDVDEHAARIYNAKQYGSRDVKRFFEAAPDSLSDLLKDAKAIKKTHERIYKALDSAVRYGSGRPGKSYKSKR